jgi:uncharacterized membrane protein YfcA
LLEVVVNIPLSVYQIFFTIVISFLGATLQGGLGFGLGLLTVPLLLNINPEFVPGPLLLGAGLLNILLIFREHRSIEINELKWTLLGRVLGTILGASILVVFPQNYLSVVFGLMVLIAVFLSLGGFHLPITKRNQIGAGTFSGIMATVAAIGGPPLALLYQNLSGSRLRGTLSGIFFVGTLLSIVSLIPINKMGIQELKLALLLSPGILLGFLVSNYLRKILDSGFIRPAVLIISALSALVVILRNVL